MATALPRPPLDSASITHWRSCCVPVAPGPRSVRPRDRRHPPRRPKGCAPALNARLVELDDRVPDDEENTRKSLTGAWRAYNRLARVVLVFDHERSAPLRHIGLFQYARYPGTRVLMRYRDVDAHTNKLSRVLSPRPGCRPPPVFGPTRDGSRWSRKRETLPDLCNRYCPPRRSSSRQARRHRPR